MDRRQYLALSGAGLTTVVSGCSGSGDEPSEENEESDDPAAGEDSVDYEPSQSEVDEYLEEAEETSEPEEPPDEVDQPETQSFTGSGSEIKNNISISGGLTVVEATHTEGESNFQVSLVGGRYDELYVDESGEYEGETADLVDDGEYYSLDIEADGDWEIDVRQPRAVSGDSLPQSLEGSKPEVHGPFELGESNIAHGSHSGDENFQVHVYFGHGSHGELLFNETGEFEGEPEFGRDHTGIGWIAVEADGGWSLDLD